MEEELCEYLTQEGITWEVLPLTRYAALIDEWRSIYGRVWTDGLRHKHGYRAQYEYEQQRAAVFCVAFLESNSGVPTITARRRHTTGYECHGPGRLPDLSAFCSLEFFVSPPDLSWTMVHTHEDHGYGGPYFVQKEWV
jgi:hypothetical protein